MYMKRNKFIPLLVILIIIFIAFVIVWNVSHKGKKEIISDTYFSLPLDQRFPTTAVPATEEAHMEKEVNSLIALPEKGEVRYVVVNDPLRYKKERFGSKTAKGDILLVYPNSNRIYVYRPSTATIIDISRVYPDKK